MPETPVPLDVTQMVERYVSNEIRNAEQYENHELLDESGISALHQVAARIYAAGFDAGTRVESERANRAAQRETATLRKALTATAEGRQ
jgi:hypothetical protein